MAVMRAGRRFENPVLCLDLEVNWLKAIRSNANLASEFSLEAPHCCTQAHRSPYRLRRKLMPNGFSLLMALEEGFGHEVSWRIGAMRRTRASLAAPQWGQLIRGWRGALTSSKATSSSV